MGGPTDLEIILIKLNTKVKNEITMKVTYLSRSLSDFSISHTEAGKYGHGKTV